MREGEGENLSSAPPCQFSVRVSRFSVALVTKEEGTLSNVTTRLGRNFTQALGEGKRKYSNTLSAFGKEVYESFEGLFFPLTLSSPHPKSNFWIVKPYFFPFSQGSLNDRGLGPVVNFSVLLKHLENVILFLSFYSPNKRVV